MRKSVFSVLLLAVVVAGALALTSPAPQAAPKCVDPTLCPIIICPPGYDFVPTTCKKCAHCVPGATCRGRRPCEEPL